MSLVTLRCTIEGVRPLLHHNCRLANPLDPYTKLLKTLTSQRDKTDETYEQMAYVEWHGGIYAQNDRPFCPDKWLYKTVLEAAKLSNMGKAYAAGYVCSDGQLIYDGPQTLPELFTHTVSENQVEHKPYVYTELVRVRGSRVLRTRPRFDAWSAIFEAEISTEVLSAQTFQELLRTAGRRLGIGDGRPRFGLFRVVSVKELTATIG